ncbi:MAG TPA: ATP synthase F1 subunit delta [Saprospiraceae bacterium]|nr:ATP synthase F1 subunit delta [Saprospiraceae bacterium]
MSAERLSARYAKSLIDLAIEQDKLERVKEDVEYFHQAAQVRDLRLLLKSPIVHTSTKRKIFGKLFTEHFDLLSNAFLDIILRKGRESYLAEIAQAFLEQYREIKKISNVKLTTATSVTAERLEEIKQKIRASGVTFPNVEINTHIDPAILGGFILEFGDKLYDASVAHQLEQLRKGFVKNSYESF